MTASVKMGCNVDFFSSIDLIDNLEEDIESQLKQLSVYTFSNFLSNDDVQKFMRTMGTIPSMPTMRYVYTYYLFKKVGPLMGNTEIVDYFHEKVINVSDATIAQVYDGCHAVSLLERAKICGLIERCTRGQSLNILWNTLRDGMISSSKFHWAVKQQSNTKKIFGIWPIVNDYYFAGPLAFGLRCEGTVKNILKHLILDQYIIFDDCGFLQSPYDGIFGISLDLCANVSQDNSGILQFSPDTCIYEIKCRFKYLFSKSGCDDLAIKYDELYKNPCRETMINFILAIKKPAIEYVAPGRLPSEADYLLAEHKDWAIHPKKKRKLTPLHKDISLCLRANCVVDSTVYILTDPLDCGGQITIKAKFELDVFTNPCHSYFYQLLLQYKVVKDYIHLGPFYSKLGTLKTYIVTAFFRKRHHTDPTDCYVGSEKLENSLEIPVILIITPVVIPAETILNSVEKAATFWAKASEETFEAAPWVSSAVYANGVITP